MPIKRISEELRSEIYFLTFTVKNWYYVFDRHNRFEILSDSLQFCQKHKQLQIYAYVFMLNHIHLIASAPDMIGFARDFKKYTSHAIQKNIIATEPNVIQLFNMGNGRFEFWQPGNMPKYIETEDFFLQKLNYIHENPVRKQYVNNPKDWVWSSANPQSVIEICRIC